MHLTKEFDVTRPREKAIEVIEQDETLVDLFPDTETEIVASTQERKTTRSRYRALGREGEATFHFDYAADGDVRFEKVCDGRVWRELRGRLRMEERGERTRVCLEMDGRTKAFVPEFTIKGPMQEQLEQMATALRERLEHEGRA